MSETKALASYIVTNHLDDIPEDVRNDLQIIFVSTIREVIEAALEVLVANPPPPPLPPETTRTSRSTEPEPLTVRGK